MANVDHQQALPSRTQANYTGGLSSTDASSQKLHTEIEYNEDDCAITTERLKKAHETYDYPAGRRRGGRQSILSVDEAKNLMGQQKIIRKALFSPSLGENDNAITSARVREKGGRFSIVSSGADGMKSQLFTANGGAVGGVLGCETVEEVSECDDETLDKDKTLEEGEEGISEEVALMLKPSSLYVPQDQAGGSKTERHGMGTVKAQLMTAKFRAHLNSDDDGVLGVQGRMGMQKNRGSIRSLQYNMNIKTGGSSRAFQVLQEEGNDEGDAEMKGMDVENISHVRKPQMARIIEEYEAMQNHPKYSLRQVLLSRRFHLYAHRFGSAQYQRTLVYPTLPQPNELYSCPWLQSQTVCVKCKEDEPVTEKARTRATGHRFIIAADTQFGILMDGFPMELPNWSQEIEISRKCVKQINRMDGNERPLFVSVCGDLVDTESSFSGAIASWKKVMNGWERNLVFDQQVRDFKRVWSGLDPDIALVCLCGNHDVGNRPTRASIKRWTNEFGDDFLSFWVNGTFNICLNNCLFSNPTGAMDLFEEQLKWLENRLVYAQENNATHIFVYSHFPWFLKHEEEADDLHTTFSAAPEGWGPPGSSFADGYFTVPYEYRKLAMTMFKKYNVTACFSGHFHQNVVAETSWGMPMIVTGPLSMNLTSEISHELSNGEVNGIGMRVVDVGERAKFTHNWILLDGEEELFDRAAERCRRQSAFTDEENGKGEVNLSPAELLQWNAKMSSLVIDDDDDYDDMA